MQGFVRQASLMAVAAAILVGGYLASRPALTGGGVVISPAAQQAKATAPDEVVIGSDPLALDQLPHVTHRVGDHVDLRVRSAKAGELMVHGYTAAGIRVNAGGHADVHFVASWPGRYILHLHEDSGEHREAAVVDVTP